MCFVDILVGFKSFDVSCIFQKCNLGGLCKSFEIEQTQAKVALTNKM